MSGIGLIDLNQAIKIKKSCFSVMSVTHLISMLIGLQIAYKAGVLNLCLNMYPI